ncbi:hypothetical protein EDD18DRAFT_1118961 [Armillaria luteobubalina]|uniref:Uncharacterized protein n=1 Tax=Armillaria luteobubalina TaxID=153913 RepID=A0AA39U0W1_9AGAR|nr:hypothetical protein EDD18DRAFT_1118961 [Armillaria luteobubalina]
MHSLLKALYRLQPAMLTLNKDAYYGRIDLASVTRKILRARVDAVFAILAYRPPMSSLSLNGPAVNNADSILSQMPISESEGTTCHLPLVSTTMATSLKSITIPIPCAPTQEATKRYVLQKHLAGLVRYLDELRHYGAEDCVRDTYVVNEVNIERLRTRIQFVQKSIEVLEKQWTAALEDIDRDLIYMTEDMVAQTTSFRGGHAAKSGSRNDRTGNTDGVVTYNKPPGRPDRPNHGGYSFVDKLIKDGKWTKQQFQSFIISKGRVHDMAKTELNVNLSYREQSEKTKLKICEQVAKEYPILHHYPDLWPVRDVLKLCLTKRHEISRYSKFSTISTL